MASGGPFKSPHREHVPGEEKRKKELYTEQDVKADRGVRTAVGSLPTYHVR